MKTQKLIAVNAVVLVLVGMMFTNSYAQRGKGMGPRGTFGECRMIDQMPDLTDAQKEKIEHIRTMHLKEINNLRKDIRIKQAELENLQSSDDAVLQDIEKKIQEVGEIKIKMHKEMAAMHFEIRNELTDEQKVHFDTRGMGPHGKFRDIGCGHGYGHGPRYGYGFYK